MTSCCASVDTSGSDTAVSVSVCVCDNHTVKNLLLPLLKHFSNVLHCKSDADLERRKHPLC